MVVVGARRDAGLRAGVPSGLREAGDRRDGDGQHDEAEREPDRDLGDPGDRLAAVDERHLVDVQGVEQQLDADEGEDDRQALGQVHEALEQTRDEEVQLTQAEQRERVRREDDVGLLREAEDGRDRVEREEHVGQADRDHDEEERGEEALAVDLGGQLLAVVVLRGGDDTAQGTDELAVRLVLLVVAVAALDLAVGEPEEQDAEEVEDPREVLDDDHAGRDEQTAREQGDGDADEQHLLLVDAGHREARHDDQEDEQVVDREGLLGDVAGEVLATEGPVREDADADAEQDGDADVDARPDGRLADGRLVRRADVTEEVEEQQADDAGDGDRPGQEMDVHVCTSSTQRVPKVSSTRVAS